MESKEKVIKQFKISDRYSVDLTGLFFFYQVSSEHTFILTSESYKVDSKVKLAALFCCSIDGLDYRKILVTGKSKNTRCLKNIELLTEYWNNQKEWISYIIHVYYSLHSIIF